jgi:hypothetical protein
LIFAWLSRRLGWLPTLLIAWASCLLIDLALSRLALGPWWSLPVVPIVAWAVTRSLPADPPGDHSVRDRPGRDAHRADGVASGNRAPGASDESLRVRM